MAILCVCMCVSVFVCVFVCACVCVCLCECVCVSQEWEQTYKQFAFDYMSLIIVWLDCEFNIRVAAAGRGMLKRESMEAAVQGTVGQQRHPHLPKIAVYASPRRRLPPQPPHIFLTLTYPPSPLSPRQCYPPYSPGKQFNFLRRFSGFSDLTSWYFSNRLSTTNAHSIATEAPGHTDLVDFY